MSLSQPVAGRSRNTEAARVFFPIPVDFDTQRESSAHPPTSPYSWKFALQLRIWSRTEGPKGSAARSVLSVLLWNSDEQGRTWLAIHAIMEHAGIGNERTVRKALDVLAKDGWVVIGRHTWATLTAEQIATGHKVPRRGDVGQAPNLYTVLSSPRQPSRPELPTRPNLLAPKETPVEQTHQQICLGGHQQICLGEPPADLPPDPYHLGSVSRMESGEGATRAPSTHLSSNAQGSKEDWGWLEAWNVLVDTHAEKTAKVYGVSPLRPDLKRDDRKAVAECLDGVAVELAATLRGRGIERELVQVRHDLASRVMALYFKRDNEHLRRVKHALRDLPREFHARIIEAKQAILRESYDAANVPRRTATLEAPAQGVKAEKAEQKTKSESAEKPLPVDVTRVHAGQVLEMLASASPKDDALVQRSRASELAPSKAVPVRPVAEPEQVQRPQAAADLAHGSQSMQRSMGRVGAPRWGDLAPVPTKLRRVSRLQVSEPEEAVESPEPHRRE